MVGVEPVKNWELGRQKIMDSSKVWNFGTCQYYYSRNIRKTMMVGWESQYMSCGYLKSIRRVV